jgi:hypothetical protein
MSYIFLCHITRYLNYGSIQVSETLDPLMELAVLFSDKTTRVV